MSRIERIQTYSKQVITGTFAYKTNKINLSIEQLTLEFDIEPLGTL